MIDDGHLQELEISAMHILREAYANFKNLGMLWSMGKTAPCCCG
jgi:sulfate adenylyltransferase subunit 2